MSLSPRNEWKLNAVLFAGDTAQITAVFRRAASLTTTTKKILSPITIPMASELSAPPKTILLADKDSIFAKSSAQVATWVLPQAVIPMSCGLKPENSAEKNDGPDSVPQRKRESPLTIRATEKQKERLRQKAQEAGVSVGGYMLAMALKADYTPPVDKERTQVLLALYREFRAQGNNLNQLAKLRNGGRITQLEEESALATLVRSHLRTHQEIRNALAHGNPEPAP
jgi:uncharacterized protein (DUF1778 family)